MKIFGGQAIFLDRNDINTDEIIPAKYLTEISKTALQEHLLEDLLLDDQNFNSKSEDMANAKVVITRENFGCGSSREHAVWAFEVNDIDVIIAESFARIFRQNMFNCGILAIELAKEQMDQLFQLDGTVMVKVDLENSLITAETQDSPKKTVECTFKLNHFDRELVSAGGWLAYADLKY
jgi:3-isopropylmalate/(R)-2-methylmalate dehydratase small subunit